MNVRELVIMKAPLRLVVVLLLKLDLGELACSPFYAVVPFCTGPHDWVPRRCLVTCAPPPPPRRNILDKLKEQDGAPPPRRDFLRKIYHERDLFKNRDQKEEKPSKSLINPEGAAKREGKTSHFWLKKTSLITRKITRASGTGTTMHLTTSSEQSRVLAFHGKRCIFKL